MKRRILYCGISVVIIAGLLIFAGQALASNYVRGSNSNANVVLDSANNWTIIRSATVTIAADDNENHACVVTASADMDFAGPSDTENQYLFVLTRNKINPATDTGSERRVSLIDNPEVNDPDSKPVSTTRHFTNLRNTNGTGGTGLHTFYLLGRKVSESDSNAAVLDASLSVICVDVR
ncbi:hypothetical protein [Desulforhabdus amnigena]|jgi:hypothetical protein|uniref:Uncharacterized protein n=1 Tax=Desulforhabdus amnigena TaxID=40218 RepID=A0A9W6FVM6_9BACT|nr:hypothetical protein [Desulforhabdus amnigena]NLJ28921.1 hypothetical protein [Deltaproteobacteria bacterium]GLI35657.1 hypothetical protein DAMNIGENAA_30900 [Desulforhabdus amnigena]